MTRRWQRRALTDRQRRAVLLAALAALVLGGIVDSFTQRDAVGRPISGREDIALLDLAERSRYEVYRTIAEVAPGAVLALDSSGERTVPLSPLLLQAFAGAEDVVSAPLDGLTFPDGTPDRFGGSSGGSWEIFLGEGPATTLLARQTSGELQIVDARLVSGSVDIVPGAGQVAEPSAEPPLGPALARSPAAIDASILIALLLLGGLLLPRAQGTQSQGPQSQRPHSQGLPPLLRLPLALLTGVALQGVVGLLRLPGITSLIVTAAIAGAAWIALRITAQPVGWTRGDLVPLAVAALLVAISAWWSRAAGFLIATADSIAYLSGARLLADGRLSADLIELKRGVAQQSLHAPAFALGAEGLQSLGAVLLLAAVTLILGLALATARRPLGRTVTAVAMLGILAVVTSPMIVTLAAYINSHALIAVLLLGLVLLLELGGGRGASQAATPGAASVGLPVGLPVAIIVAVLVLLRAEGTLLVGIVLLGTLRGAAPVSGSPARAAWWSLGVTTLLWNGLLVQAAAARGEAPATVVTVLLVLGGLLLLVPHLLSAVPDRLRRSVPIGVGTALWAATLGLVLYGGEGVRFVSAAVTNLGEGFGNWGTAGPALVLLAILMIALGPDPRDGQGALAARWALIGFVPLALITKLGDGLDDATATLDVLLSGGGRVGWADSVNRMWMHVALLVIALVVMRTTRPAAPAAGSGAGSGPAAGSGSGPGAGAGSGSGPVRALRGGRAVVLVLASVWVAAQWAPAHVGDGVRALESTQEVLLDLPLVEVIGEMIARSEVRQDVLLGAGDDPPRGASASTVCIRPNFVNFGRDIVGAVDIVVATSAVSATFRVDAATLGDWGEERFCLALPPDEPTLEGLQFTVRGVEAPLGSEPGGAVSLLRAATQPTFPSAVFATPERDGREVSVDGPIAMRVTLDYDLPRRADGFEGALITVTDALVLWLPRVVALLVVVLIGSSLSQGRVGARRSDRTSTASVG